MLFKNMVPVAAGLPGGLARASAVVRCASSEDEIERGQRIILEFDGNTDEEVKEQLKLHLRRGKPMYMYLDMELQRVAEGMG